MGTANYKQQQFTCTLTGDQGVALLIWINPNIFGAGAVAEITVSSAALFTFQINGVDDVRVNPGGLNAGQIADAEAATLGAVRDLINATSATSGWGARLASSFADGDTTDILPITETTVTENGIAAGTGARLGGVGFDYSDLSTIIQLCSFGRESDVQVSSAARSQVSNIRKTRDIDDGTFSDALVVLDGVARLFKTRGVLGDAGTGPLTITAYAATQSQTRAQARVLWTRTYTEDTQAIDDFPPPADLVTLSGERMIIECSSGAALDAINCTFIGGYGDAGNLPSV